MRGARSGTGIGCRLGRAIVAESPRSPVPFRPRRCICPRLRIGDEIVRTITMVARFGSTREVTLDELRVELVFPADDAAAAFFRRAAAG